jgi:hypothetical protein
VLSLSNDQVRFLRLHAQRLIPQPADTMTSVVHVVKDRCGIQAPDANAAMLALRVRSIGLVAGDRRPGPDAPTVQPSRYCCKSFAADGVGAG